MASAAVTLNLALPQWAAGEKPERTDFNTAFLTLDGIPAVSGWVQAGETWTYASASTITVASGAASRYQKDDKIKWTQEGVKYGVIAAVADTLLTIAVNTDFVVTNAAISLNYISRVENPFGFPASFNFTTVITSSSGTATTVSATGKYRTRGSFVTVFLSVSITNKGTAAGNIIATTPLACASGGCGSATEYAFVGLALVCQIATAASVVQIATYTGATPWTDGWGLRAQIEYQF